MTAVLWIVLKAIAGPLAAFLVGYFLPSPLQKAARKQEEIHNAENKADSSRGDVSDLDNLP